MCCYDDIRNNCAYSIQSVGVLAMITMSTENEFSREFQLQTQTAVLCPIPTWPFSFGTILWNSAKLSLPYTYTIWLFPIKMQLYTTKNKIRLITKTVFLFFTIFGFLTCCVTRNQPFLFSIIRIIHIILLYYILYICITIDDDVSDKHELMHTWTYEGWEICKRIQMYDDLPHCYNLKEIKSHKILIGYISLLLLPSLSCTCPYCSS